MRTKFPPETILDAVSVLSDIRVARGVTSCHARWDREVSTVDGTMWTLDNDAEFFSLYRSEDVDNARYVFATGEELEFRCKVDLFNANTSLYVTTPSRSDLEKVCEVFESSAKSSRLSPERAEHSIRAWLRIFIGHGRDPSWRELKDHLQDKHSYRVEAYETGPRAGLHIIDILQKAQDHSSFAIIILTGENLDASGFLHARDNVIHEAGLFQGRLGFKRAIVLLENGCEEFSNLAVCSIFRSPRATLKNRLAKCWQQLGANFSAKTRTDDDSAATRPYCWREQT